MRRLLPLLALVALPGCYMLSPFLQDHAVDACRERAQADGWRVQSVQNVRREGTAQRVEMRATKFVVVTRTLVCYYDPVRGTATI